MDDGRSNLAEAAEALTVEPRIILADGRLSAAELASAKGRGSLSMAAFEGGKAYLELGGVVLAEGALRRRGGRYAFIASRAYAKEGEAL